MSTQDIWLIVGLAVVAAGVLTGFVGALSKRSSSH